MISLYKLLRKLLRKWILESSLSHTAPLTRFIVALMMCGAIFFNNVLALGVLTTLMLVIVAASPDSLKRHWFIFLLPVVGGGLLTLPYLIPAADPLIGIAEVVFIVWKLFVLVLTAVVFNVLVPQRDFRYLSRTLPYPQVWAAVVAAVRSAEIGGWAVATVRRTIRSRSISVLQSPWDWGDACLTAFVGHVCEFVKGLLITLRSRGMESDSFTPRKKIPTFNGVDIVVLLAFALSFLAMTTI